MSTTEYEYIVILVSDVFCMKYAGYVVAREWCWGNYNSHPTTHVCYPNHYTTRYTSTYYGSGYGIGCNTSTESTGTPFRLFTPFYHVENCANSRSVHQYAGILRFAKGYPATLCTY